MPITVSCPACGSRFSLSDDLYRRRVVGSLVKVKCRNCRAEIAVDATESATVPSEEAPRKHPLPPRPRAITQMGLGEPPPPASLATATPLPFELPQPPHSSLPLDATVTPLPMRAAPPKPVSADPDIWGDDETIAINATKLKAPPKPPITRALPLTREEEPELVDAEEIPVSSSGAPTLDALTMEAGGAHVPHGRPPPDEFLVSLSTGNNSSLGAPTIDVTGFASEIDPASADVTSFASEIDPPSADVTSFASEIDPPSADISLEERELEYRPRANTVPLYDMNAVLPAASPSAKARSAGSPPVPPSKPAPDPSFSEGRARERKFVIPPEVAAAAPVAAKRRRTSPVVWVGFVAAAGAFGVGVGLREHRMKEASTNEAALFAASPATNTVVNTQSALPAEAPSAEASEAASAAPLASVAPPIAPAAPTVQTVTVGTTRSVAPSTVAAVKTSSNAPSNASPQPSAPAEPAVEKPITADKAVEAHNAPPPAAPDTEFDRAAARNALASAAAQASSCRKEGDPSGTANLTITFAPSGRVTSAQIQGPPFSGTPTGGCIASTMRRASVPAFSGDYVTVSKTIVVQ